ncbi:purine-binding chemotaxis protein CheW [Pseudomonas sp. MPFS]|uniref:chemotaxis protein CheW n=1 Tax=Pseudomonas sp. MPFS TaxID=2795724 RepID=UPI001F142AD6|nr:chemotaxis protein CheW [Pseudomonas sp. MPFS]UMZ13202.1 purine-binding chemotaxis protein CheW [Pseudomonas sp. MPFS]
MDELAHKRNGAASVKTVLFLVFRIGQERYALRAVDVVEVLPRLQLKPIAQAPGWVSGVFAYRGTVVPVIDLCQLTFGRPAQLRTSTRLVLVHYRGEAEQPARVLGLLLEQANDTLRCDPQQFQPYGLDNAQAPYLGPVREDAQGLLQWVRVDHLLRPEVRELLFPSPPLDLAALEEPR